ncbi:MAG TPA: hypothetical protein VEK31_00040 [Xanthobacteraceae bacterium]|nr:hypothetical protein [Xanthobacteraceae bacterium]
MILAPLFGATLTVAVATAPIDDPTGAAHLSAQEKIAATQPLVRSATECIVHAIVTDPNYGKATVRVGDLIVASMPSCVAPMRAMIAAYDQYYGEGSGKAFFMGPYLDLLPKLVGEAASGKTLAP